MVTRRQVERMADEIERRAVAGDKAAGRLMDLAFWDTVLTCAFDDIEARGLPLMPVFDDDGQRLIDGRPAEHSRIQAMRARFRAGFDRRARYLLKRIRRRGVAP